MSELADVAGGQTITSSFTNQVKERSAMRYTSAAARDTSIPAPIAGSLAYLQDSDTLTLYDGTNWVDVIDASGGTFTGPVDMNGQDITGAFSIRDQSNITRLLLTDGGALNLYGQSGGAPAVAIFDTAIQLKRETQVEEPITVVDTDQNLSDGLLRNVFITDVPPAFTIKGALWLEPLLNQLSYSDGTQWILAIQGT